MRTLGMKLALVEDYLPAGDRAQVRALELARAGGEVLVPSGDSGPREGEVPIPIIATQLAESLAVPFVSFGCLSAAWLAVAVGMRKQL